MAKVERTTNPDGTVTLDSQGQPRIVTLEDLLSLAQVDLDVYRVRSWKANNYEQAQKGEDGPEIISLRQVKATLEPRRTGFDPERAAKHFAKLIGKARPLLPKPVRRSKTRCEMVEVEIPDLHLGKRAWDRETLGRDWDVGKAAQAYRVASADLLNRAVTARTQRIVRLEAATSSTSTRCPTRRPTGRAKTKTTDFTGPLRRAAKCWWKCWVGRWNARRRCTSWRFPATTIANAPGNSAGG